MMEAETVHETLEFHSTLARFIARETLLHSAAVKVSDSVWYECCVNRGHVDHLHIRITIGNLCNRKVGFKCILPVNHCLLLRTRSKMWRLHAVS